MDRDRLHIYGADPISAAAAPLGLRLPGARGRRGSQSGAYVIMSGNGTFRTFFDKLGTSAFGSKTEVRQYYWSQPNYLVCPVRGERVQSAGPKNR